MISTMQGKSLAGLLREARERTIDSSTSSPFTQVRLAELIGVSDSVISKWERGESLPTPEMINVIARYLDVTVTAMALALGLDLEPPPMTSRELELLAAFRRLSPSPILQDSAMTTVKALRQLLDDQAPASAAPDQLYPNARRSQSRNRVAEDGPRYEV